MIAKGYKVLSWKRCQSKNGVCDESPPKRRMVAETFAWRLDDMCEYSHVFQANVAWEWFAEENSPWILSQLINSMSALNFCAGT